MDNFPPAKQRPALLALRDALGCRDNALRRDECGDWRIEGRFGHIYAIPEGFQMCFRGAREFEEPPPGSQKWANAKKAMPFTSVAQDGDGEGTLVMDRLPAAAPAKIIRDRFGVSRKREISDAERERLRTIGRPFASSPSVVEGGAGAPEPASDNARAHVPAEAAEEEI